jgi:hypothetical protein
VNVGTIGHVDHGKTTLTAAITKVGCVILFLLHISLHFQTDGLILWRLFPRYYRSWPRQGRPKPLLSTRSTRLRRRKPEESPLRQLGPSTSPIVVPDR